MLGAAAVATAWQCTGQHWISGTQLERCHGSTQLNRNHTSKRQSCHHLHTTTHHAREDRAVNRTHTTTKTALPAAARHALPWAVGVHKTKQRGCLRAEQATRGWVSVEASSRHTPTPVHVYFRAQPLGAGTTRGGSPHPLTLQGGRSLSPQRQGCPHNAAAIKPPHIAGGDPS
jgi:hypothetical protein